MKAKSKQNQREKKHQKIFFGVFLFIGILALGLGIFQFNHQLHSPFKKPKVASSQNLEGLAYEELQGLQNLKSQDIDGDGLNDYDELYAYKTSPYLVDSDSDGVDDKTEIDKGDDPNCPAGKNCDQPKLAQTTGAEEVAGSELSLSPENLPIDTLRQTLRDAGVPEDTLNKIDDETLRQMYEEVVAEEGINTNIAANVALLENTNESVNTNQAIDVNSLSLTDLENLNSSQIRELLTQLGIGKEELDQVDDQTLEEIFKQAINEQGV